MTNQLTRKTIIITFDKPKWKKCVSVVISTVITKKQNKKRNKISKIIPQKFKKNGTPRLRLLVMRR